MLTRAFSALMAVAMVGAGLLAPAVLGAWPASARCQDPYVTYRTYLIKTVHRKFPDYPVWVNGPGGKMSVTTKTADSTTGTFGTSVEAEISGIIASAKTQVSASISRTVSAEVGVTYERHIHAGMFGHMAYGTWAKKVGWKKILHTSLCTRDVLKKGRAVIPTKALGIKFWQTR
jgi:hypothetical protein